MSHHSLTEVFAPLRGLLPPLLLFGFFSNLSVLISPLFMMHVLDRVVPSGNLQTLGLLLLLAVATLITISIIEVFRDKTLSNAGAWVEQQLTEELAQGATPQRLNHLGEVSRLKEMFQSGRAGTALDLPWLPLFAVVLFLIHPAFLALAGFAVTVFIAKNWLISTLTEARRRAAMSARASASTALAHLDLTGPSAALMGIASNLAQRYLSRIGQAQPVEKHIQNFEHWSSAASRLMRGLIQILSLSLGAALVSQGALTAGGMIGASIILGKSVGTLESAINNWSFVKDLRQSIRNLSGVLGDQTLERTEVADLSGALTAHNLTYPRSPGAPPRLDRISLSMTPGQCLAILGESGSGKTSLLYALAGIDPAPIGNVFLDETELHTLDQSTRMSMIGVVPQLNHVLPATIADNIARFSNTRDDAKVLAAARLAGVHGLISALPEAYETHLGEHPSLLSSGQKQRIALARALYDPPKYLFMDEPNALLDHQAERQLGDAIHRLKEAGTTIVFTAHRTGIIGLADQVLVMEDGKVIDKGPRAEIMGRLANSHRRLRIPVSGSALQDLNDWVARQFVRDGDEDFKARTTIVATELYNFACENGPDNTDRFLNFEFSFEDDHTCSVTLSEARRMELEAKVHKVRKVACMTLPETSELKQDEMSLMTVFKIADRVEHREEDERSAIFAEIVQSETEAKRLN